VSTATGATTLRVLCVECSEFVVCRGVLDVDVVGVCNTAVLSSREEEVEVMVDVEEP
jgi:hypothetical protein